MYKFEIQRKPSHPDNNRMITGNFTPPHDKYKVQMFATEACLFSRATNCALSALIFKSAFHKGSKELSSHPLSTSVINQPAFLK